MPPVHGDRCRGHHERRPAGVSPLPDLLGNLEHRRAPPGRRRAGGRAPPSREVGLRASFRCSFPARSVPRADACSAGTHCFWPTPCSFPAFLPGTDVGPCSGWRDASGAVQCRRRSTHGHAAAGCPVRSEGSSPERRLRGRRDPDAVAWHRREHRDLQRRQRRAPQALAVSGSRSGSSRSGTRRSTASTPAARYRRATSTTGAGARPANTSRYVLLLALRLIAESLPDRRACPERRNRPRRRLG